MSFITQAVLVNRFGSIVLCTFEMFSRSCKVSFDVDLCVTFTVVSWCMNEFLLAMLLFFTINATLLSLVSASTTSK